MNYTRTFKTREQLLHHRAMVKQLEVEVKPHKTIVKRTVTVWGHEVDIEDAILSPDIKVTVKTIVL